VRLGVDVGPTRALAIGSELTSRGEGGMNPGPYAAQAIARMPLGQLAAIADVEPRVPARPQPAARWDPEADAVLRALVPQRDELTARGRSVRGAGAAGAGGARRVERQRRAAVIAGDDTVSLQARSARRSIRSKRRWRPWTCWPGIWPTLMNG
jgi:hypothetical protein